MEVYPRTSGELPQEPLEAVPLNPGEGIELHELWLDWLDRYSRWRTENPKSA